MMLSLFLYICHVKFTYTLMLRTAKRTFLLLLIFTIGEISFAQNKSVSFVISSKDCVSMSFIPADEGKPDLKTVSRYVAIPKDADFEIKITSKNERETENVSILPAAKLPSDLDATDYQAVADADTYTKDVFYPENTISYERLSFRGFDVVLIGIAIERYNPVKKVLRSIDNVTVTIEWRPERPEGARAVTATNNTFTAMIRDIVVNPEFFDEMMSEEQDYLGYDKRDGCDYLIITPDNDEIKEWADTLRNFREEQGIITKVVRISAATSNDPDSLKAYLRHGYENWSPVPAAVLLLGDYSNDPALGITTYALTDHPEGHAYEPYLADNKLVDFDDNGLPDMVIARMPAASGGEARHLVKKTLQYERHPCPDASYYEKIATAMGYQLSRWFQLCTEIIAGYMEMHGKRGVHLNAIHQGVPGSVWSTGQRTEQVINTFGPNGLGYIPSTMSHLTDWDAGADDITQTLRDGTFMLIHRDHGSYKAWSEPYFNNNYINNLDNEQLTFIMSANCQTGHFGYSENGGDCLAERFLRIENGAVGIVAASELSFSYVNDTYVWGFFDYLYPDFMPEYGTQNIDFQYPAFANAYGKYFLEQSSFPYNASLKTLTNNLFHYFGDAYLCLYSEVPRHLSVSHANGVLPGTMSVKIYADEGATVALSVDNKLIARKKFNYGEATLNFTDILHEGQKIKVVATKQNHYRHESYIYVSESLDIDESSAEQDFYFYPNPANDIIHVKGKNISNIKIFNLLGQEIKHATASDDITEINCNDMPNGVYVIMAEGKHCSILVVRR